MRDPARIERILSLLRAYWYSCPDLRLGQIVSNATDNPDGDPFYLEDDAFERELRRSLLKGKS